MKITLTDKAIHWFENEFPLHEGESIRFFGKTYGQTEVHEGFSLGLETDNPANYNENDIFAITEENGRQYFTTREDDWFFSGYDLEIDLNDDLNEPSYHFNEVRPLRDDQVDRLEV